MLQNVIYTRRTTPRVDADDAVNALWNCGGREDVSHVENLNLSGLFIKTPLRNDPGAFIEIDFLVNEGPIHARAVVRHVAAGQGFGLKLLLSMSDQHRLHFGALMRRLYSACGNAKVTQIRERVDRPANATESVLRS